MTDEDKAQNFRRLEQETEKWKERALAAEAALDASPTDDGDNAEVAQWKAKAEIAEVAAHRGVLLEAGFDPASGEAKALLRDLAAGEVEADPAAVVAHAADDYGWTPNLRIFSASEAVQIESAQHHADLRIDAVSDNPPTVSQQIAEAEGAGNVRLARKLKNDLLTANMAASNKAGRGA